MDQQAGIVVVGGGVAGLEIATALGRHPRSSLKAWSARGAAWGRDAAGNLRPEARGPA